MQGKNLAYSEIAIVELYMVTCSAINIMNPTKVSKINFYGRVVLTAVLISISCIAFTDATTDIANALGELLNNLHDMMPFHIHFDPPPDDEHYDDGHDGFNHTAYCPKCTCGLPNNDNRIVGGRPTLVNEFPWVAALSRYGKLYCGATLINDRYVLTAAHCVQGPVREIRLNTVVILAEHNTAQMGETNTDTRGVAEVHLHPKFNPDSHIFDGDLALLQFTHPVRFRYDLAPACLPEPDLDYAGIPGIVAGWGRVQEQGKPSAELQVIQVPILSNEECLRESQYSPIRLTEHMLCAGHLYGGVDSCQGDSGGALLVQNGLGQLATVGVVSWGEGCARPMRPGVYTRVNHYLSWIRKITKNSCHCY